MVAAVLLDRYPGAGDGLDEVVPGSPDLDVLHDSGGLPPGVTEVALEEEVTRAASEQPGEVVSAQEVLLGVLRTVESLAAREQVQFAVSLREELEPVAVQRIVLRQLLLSLLSYAISLGQDTQVEVAGANAAHAVELRIVARRPPGAPSEALTVPRVAAAEQVAVARRLSETQSAALHVETPDDLSVAFHLALPGAAWATVLVVDDNPDVARLFQRYLGGTSYRLIQARTGAGALQAAREARPDAIVLDVLLPSEDGWEVLEAIRADPTTRGIPVVVCSVLPDRLLALSLGVVDFLSKPVTREALLAALDRCLRATT
jgi:CheY-like chemotaxis protein